MTTITEDREAVEAWENEGGAYLVTPDRSDERDGVMVYDVASDSMITVTKAEAAAGLMRYARSLGAGTPACGVWEQRAIALLAAEEHYHRGSDGRPGHRNAPPCTCETPNTITRPKAAA